MGNEIHLSLQGALLCDYEMTGSASHKGNSSQKDEHTGSAGQLQIKGQSGFMEGVASQPALEKLLGC